MTEFKEAQGNLEGFQIGKKGIKTDGTEWQMYKYIVGGKTFSGFKKLEEFEVNIGDFVIVTYTEKPNPQNAENPYKNIVNIVKGVSQEEVKDSNEQYNVEPVTSTSGKTYSVEQAPQPQVDYNAGAFFGMVFNNTIKWIINERNLKGEGTTYTLDENFDKIFDHLYSIAEKKRKGKLQ